MGRRLLAPARRPWTLEEDALLGQISDEELAAEPGAPWPPFVIAGTALADWSRQEEEQLGNRARQGDRHPPGSLRDLRHHAPAHVENPPARPRNQDVTNQ
jgi:hypothetical protein